MSNRPGGVLISLQDKKAYVVCDSRHNYDTYEETLEYQPDLKAVVSKYLSSIDLALWTHDYLENCHVHEQVRDERLSTLEDWDYIFQMLEKADIPYTIDHEENKITIRGYDFSFDTVDSE